MNKIKSLVTLFFFLFTFSSYSQNSIHSKSSTKEIDKLYKKYIGQEELKINTIQGEIIGKVYTSTNDQGKPNTIQMVFPIASNISLALNQFLKDFVNTKRKQGFKMDNKAAESHIINGDFIKKRLDLLMKHGDLICRINLSSFDGLIIIEISDYTRNGSGNY